MSVFAGITTELRREWHLAVSEPAVLVTLSMVGCLTVLALLTGTLRTQERRERQQLLERDNSQQRAFLESAFDDDSPASNELTSARQERRSELQLSARSPDLLRFTAGLWRSILPPSLLAGLSTGASEEWPDHYHHEGSSMTATLSRSIRTNPLLAAVGTFDLTLLVGAVLPLTVIILTYNLVAADREQGRWDLIRAHAASMPRLVTVRCLIRIAALGLVVILVTVCWTFLVPAGSRNGVAARNFALWSLWLCAHLAFWAAMTMLVNSLRLSSSGSGLLLLLGWCLLVLAIPSAVERGINSRFSMPSFSDLIAMELEVRKQIEQDANAVWADFLQRHAGIHLDEDNPQREFLLRDIAMSEVIRLRVHERTDEYFQQFLQREELLDRCQLLSPLLAWRTAADQCAGTSLRHFLALARQTETFHDHFLSHFETLSLAGRELTLANIREVPRFDVKDFQSSLDSAPLLLSATSLLLWTAVCGWLSWQMFQRSGRH